MNGQLTVSDALAQGLQTTIIGLSIVFGVLAILMIVLMLMKVFFYKEEQKTEDKTVQEVKTAPAKMVVEEEDEEELIAVLTAAIAASLNTSTYNLQIKSYRRIGNNNPAWNRAGINDTINNRL